MPLRRFLRAYYAYVFLTEFMLGYAVYAVWFQLGGLGVWEIALLFAIWSALAVVFELPSGALSDHFDRRWLLVAAPFFKADRRLLDLRRGELRAVRVRLRHLELRRVARIGLQGGAALRMDGERGRLSRL